MEKLQWEDAPEEAAEMPSQEPISSGKFFLILSFVPIILLLLSATHNAIFGYYHSFMFSRTYRIGFDAFKNTMLSGLLSFGFLIPILPTCLIYQIVYLIRWIRKRFEGKFKEDDKPLPLEISLPNTVSLASDVYCLEMRNIEIVAMCESEQISILRKESLWQNERFDENLPPISGIGTTSVRITFDDVLNSNNIDLDVMAFNSADDLIRSGILIYFQGRCGMFMLIVSSENKLLFHLSDDGEWVRTDLDLPSYTLN